MHLVDYFQKFSENVLKLYFYDLNLSLCESIYYCKLSQGAGMLMLTQRTE